MSLEAGQSRGLVDDQNGQRLPETRAAKLRLHEQALSQSRVAESAMLQCYALFVCRS
jgi:hypothetical protein